MQQSPHPRPGKKNGVKGVFASPAESSRHRRRRDAVEAHEHAPLPNVFGRRTAIVIAAAMLLIIALVAWHDNNNMAPYEESRSTLGP